MDLLTLLFQIANQIGQVLNRQENLLQAIRNIANSVVDQAVEHTPFQIETTVVATSLNVANPTYGLAAIKTELDTMSAQLVALGAPQQTGSPVTLPVTPPAGYGGPSVGDIAAQVWHWIPVDAGRFPASEDVIAKLDGFLDAFDGYYDLPTQGGGPFRAQGNFNPRANFPFATNPNVNPTSIIPSDTDIGAWLNRMGPLTWSFDSGSYYWFAHEPFTNGGWYYCTLSNAEFLWLRENNAALVKPNLPPVWPGLSGVSLLTPFTLADGLIITEAMDGVIVAITSVSPRTQNIPYGTVQAYGHIGSLTFGDDNGDYEEFQYLTFANQVYCPRFLKRASSVAVRVKSGLVGTVTPWTLA